MGAIGGLVLAHRSRTPSISGWKRHLGAAVFGAALGCAPLTYVTFMTLQTSANDAGKDLIKKNLYRAIWDAIMFRNMLDQRDLSLRADGIDVPVVAPFDPVTLLAENGHDYGKKVLMAQIGERAIENELMVGTKELRLLPLKGEVADRVMTKNPPPSVYIKYLMSPFGSDAEKELEKHTLTITQKREQVAFEAEQAWHHLAKKEAEYLDATRSLGEEADPAQRRYLEVLGTVHWSLWSRASQRDWMITHMQQRKQQLTTHPQESDIRETGLPSAKPAPTATSTKFHFTTEILEGLPRRTEERRTDLLQSIRLLETVLSQLPIKPDRSRSSLGRPVPTREGYEHAITKLEKEIDTIESDTKVIKQLIDDVELGWK
ncbi:hypothetical protein NU219Hw_g7337t1 [Hortaea werneckii]